MAERTRRAVPLEMYCMHANDPSSGLVTRVISDAGYGEVARVALERVQFRTCRPPSAGWSKVALRPCLYRRVPGASRSAPCATGK